MTSEQIVKEFSKRADQFGQTRLTVKQIAWLCGQIRRENPSEVIGREYVGSVIDNHIAWRIVIFPNGAGFLVTREAGTSLY